MNALIKMCLLLVALALALAFGSTSFADSFGTLFTTPSERKTIDSNRYNVNKDKKQTAVTSVTEEPKELLYKTVTYNYQILGITMISHGLDSVWINNKRYEDGDVLNKKITIKIDAAKQRVRLTVRGGKKYYGQSGELVSISIKEPLLD